LKDRGIDQEQQGAAAPTSSRSGLAPVAATRPLPLRDAKLAERIEAAKREVARAFGVAPARVTVRIEY
jgi:hypothetical protein